MLKGQLAFGLLASILAVSVRASEGDALETKFEVFRDRNEVTALSPLFELKKTIAKSLSLMWEGQMDAVTGASREWGVNGSGQLDAKSGASARLDGISGASRKDEPEPEIRWGSRLGLTWSRNGRVFSGSLYASKESDYQSFSPSISGAWDFAERNTTLSWGGAWFFDKMTPYGEWGRLGGGEKRVQSYSLGLTQSFTPLTLGGITTNFIRTTGYIGHPYNPVTTRDSGLIAEFLPEKKDALAVSLQAIQGWLWGEKLGSVNLEYRNYRDSWDLRSNTLTIQLSQNLLDATMVRLQGRYYSQVGAWFAQTDLYQGSEVYRTADIRFHRFDSWMAGLKVASEFPDSWGAWLPRRWNLSYDHLIRNTRGNTRLYQLYAPDEFYQQGTARAGLGWDL